MTRATVLSLILATLASAATPVPALEGLDPVLLTEGREVPGEAKFSEQSGQYLYHFSSEESRARFRRDPARYGIQLGGACARMGAPTKGRPDAYFVHQGRIYIFGSTDCYKKFSAAPAKYLQPVGEVDWTATPESAARATRLMGRAVAAMGGAEHWNAVAGYVEVREMNGQVTRTVRWPDAMLSVVKRGDREFGSTVQGGRVVQLFQGQGSELPSEFAVSARADFARDIIPLMLQRKSAHYLRSEAGEDLLALRAEDGKTTTIHLNKVTGRIAGISFSTLGPDGFGKAQVKFSDYRETSGLILPFKAEFHFDGAAVPARSWTVESYFINPADLDARLKLPGTIR